MVVDEGQRLRMVGRLQEILGVEEAGTLMEYLPGAGWADVATKGDLAMVRGELGGEIGALRGERGGEIGGLRGEIGELRGEIGELRGELRGEIRELRGELHITIARETRSLFFALVGVLAAYGAGLVAAVRLH